jgi:hypothetical protein
MRAHHRAPGLRLSRPGAGRDAHGRAMKRLVWLAVTIVIASMIAYTRRASGL